MNYIKEVPIKSDDAFNVVIEIMKGTTNKDELVYPLFDKLVTNKKVKYKYPYNYGVMPGTHGEGNDNDPLDIILWGKKQKPLSIVKVEIVGLIKTRDDKGYDPKIICVPKGTNLTIKQKIKLIDKTTKFISKFKKFKNVQIDDYLYGPEDAEQEIKKAALSYKTKGTSSTGARRVR